MFHLLLDSEKQSFQGLYDRVASPPERDAAEHPYDYIHRAYGESLNSELTGLPGYSPPGIVRLLNGITVLLLYVVVASAALFVGTLAVTILAAVIETISNIVFTLPLPFVGWTIFTFPLEDPLVVTATPVLVTFLFFWGMAILEFVFDRASQKLSKPYENEYYDWLMELKPPEGGYPSGLAVVWSDGEFNYGDIPTAAPPSYREQRTFEKITYMLKASGLFISLFIAKTFLHQNRLMYDNQNYPMNVFALKNTTIQ